MATKKTESPDSAPGVATYCDKRYAQRFVFTAGMRQLAVTRGRIEVPADDREALECLDNHADFARLE